ncbi:hypothetical protein Q5H93_21515 [Hymenobacter sp. ASUV-10]|uniref:Uncharacterized protein n=1 Tax=Hymenobacter aranciens TaxID=3063996 RepID=A0ABT9BGE1_9BACT|nr:hypothetical protein [Hymenobacter sp. ASUV-10]MDO7877338.1 hypothetical protein [Hymenobacter sp. ASUV-10]
MKRLLLSLAFITAALAARAQVSPLIRLVSAGITVGTSAALQSKAGLRDQYVPQANYQGMTFPQKRTARGKLNSGPGKPEILQVEALLQRCYTTLTADPHAEVVPAELYETIQKTQQLINELRPEWDTDPYTEELAFYHEQDRARKPGK